MLLKSLTIVLLFLPIPNVNEFTQLNKLNFKNKIFDTTTCHWPFNEKMKIHAVKYMLMT